MYRTKTEPGLQTTTVPTSSGGCSPPQVPSRMTAMGPSITEAHSLITKSMLAAPMCVQMMLTGMLAPVVAANVPVVVRKPREDSTVCRRLSGCSSVDSAWARRALPTDRMRGATSPRCCVFVL